MLGAVAGNVTCITEVKLLKELKLQDTSSQHFTGNAGDLRGKGPAEPFGRLEKQLDVYRVGAQRA